MHVPLDYRIGVDEINAGRAQVEIDFTTEHLGTVTVFEAKNGEPADFNVFQLFNPFRYYSMVRDTREIPMDAVDACHLLRHRDRLRLYLYTFADPHDPGSIQLLRNAEYALVESWANQPTSI